MAIMQSSQTWGAPIATYKLMCQAMYCKPLVPCLSLHCDGSSIWPLVTCNLFQCSSTWRAQLWRKLRKWSKWRHGTSDNDSLLPSEDLCSVSLTMEEGEGALRPFLKLNTSTAYDVGHTFKWPLQKLVLGMLIQDMAWAVWQWAALRLTDLQGQMFAFRILALYSILILAAVAKWPLLLMQAEKLQCISGGAADAGLQFQRVTCALQSPTCQHWCSKALSCWNLPTTYDH